MQEFIRSSRNLLSVCSLVPLLAMKSELHGDWPPLGQSSVSAKPKFDQSRAIVQPLRTHGVKIVEPGFGTAHPR